MKVSSQISRRNPNPPPFAVAQGQRFFGLTIFSQRMIADDSFYSTFLVFPPVHLSNSSSSDSHGTWRKRRRESMSHTGAFGKRDTILTHLGNWFQTLLGVDSFFILFNHRSFQKPIAVFWLPRRFSERRIPGFRMEMEVSYNEKVIA